MLPRAWQQLVYRLASDLGWGAWETDPATRKHPFTTFSFHIIPVTVWVLLLWYRAEPWVRCYPHERLGGVEHKGLTLSCKRATSYSVTWKGNMVSAQCLGFFEGGIFCLVCFVISSAVGWLFFILFSLVFWFFFVFFPFCPGASRKFGMCFC